MPLGLVGSIIGNVLNVMNNENANYANAKIARMNNRYNLAIARETNAANLNLAREQNEFNLNQWKLNNAYNDPANQMRRNVAAGMSRAAAAQAVSGVPSSPVQSADLSVMGQPAPAQPYSVNPSQFDFSGLDMIGMMRQIQALKQDKITTDKMEMEHHYDPSRLLTMSQLQQYQLEEVKNRVEAFRKEFPYRFDMLKNDAAKSFFDVISSRLEVKNMKLKLKQSREELGFLREMRPFQIKQAFVDLNNSLQDFENKKKQGEVLDQTITSNYVKSAFDKYGGVPDSFAGTMAIAIMEGIIKPEDVERNIDNFTNIIKYLRQGLWANITDSASDLINWWQHRNEPDIELTPPRAGKKRYSSREKHDYSGDTSILR